MKTSTLGMYIIGLGIGVAFLETVFVAVFNLLGFTTLAECAFYEFLVLGCGDSLYFRMLINYLALGVGTILLVVGALTGK